jgi:hypothetical protein
MNHKPGLIERLVIPAILGLLPLGLLWNPPPNTVDWGIVEGTPGYTWYHIWAAGVYVMLIALWNVGVLPLFRHDSDQHEQRHKHA